MNLNWVFILFLLPIYISAECNSQIDSEEINNSKAEALKFKLIAVASILAASATGVCIPLFGKMFESLCPESNVFLGIKFFAAGVILATGFVHVFPDANESLDNPCLGEKSWGDFPLANFVAMVAAVAVMIVETAVTSMLNRWDYSNVEVESGDDEEKHHGHMHRHTHASRSHAHVPDEDSATTLRHRIISQVGIIIHSVIIVISLGVSMNPKTIKPFIIALSFHQMFEGITEAKFKVRTIATMSIFFSVTTPIGIVIGFVISNTYDKNSHTALITQGTLNAASAGILIYMALVDLLAVDFMNPKVQTSPKLKTLAFVRLLLVLGCMSLLAKWA